MDERRLLLAVVLSLAILIGWQLLFPPEERKPAEVVQQQQTVATPAATVERRLATPDTATTPASTRRTTPATPPTTHGMISADLSPLTENKPVDIKIQTDLYDCVLSTEGGGIKRFDLKEYHTELNPDSPPVQMVAPFLSSGSRPLDTELVVGGLTLPPSVVFESDKTSLDLSLEGAPQVGVVTMTLKTKAGMEVRRKYTFERGSYKIDFKIEVAEVPASTSGVSLPRAMPVEATLKWNTPVDPEKAESRFRVYGIIAYVGGKYEEERLAKLRKKGPFSYKKANWAGFSDEYFLSVLVPEKAGSIDLAAGVEGDEGEQIVTEDISLPGGEVRIGEPFKQSLTVYIGPKEHKRLLAIGKDLEPAMGYGRLKIFIVPLLWVLRFFNDLVGNWGLSIILLTVFVKIIFFPLTHKSYQQMKAMQALQPRIKELQAKYKGEKEKMNTELMALYRSHKVNPLGGCLPMLLQLPVLYALYRALYVGIELRHSPFIWWINDLSSPEQLFTLPILGGVSIGFMPLLMGASMFVQQKMTPTAATDPMQQKMFMAMPVVFTVMSFGFPAGLVLYWFVSNLLTIIQQYVINRRGN